MPALDVRQLLQQARDQKKKVCCGLSAFDTASSLATSLIEARIQDRLPLNPAEHALSPVRMQRSVLQLGIFASLPTLAVTDPGRGVVRARLRDSGRRNTAADCNRSCTCWKMDTSW